MQVGLLMEIQSLQEKVEALEKKLRFWMSGWIGWCPIFIT